MKADVGSSLRPLPTVVAMALLALRLSACAEDVIQQQPNAQPVSQPTPVAHTYTKAQLDAWFAYMGGHVKYDQQFTIYCRTDCTSVEKALPPTLLTYRERQPPGPFAPCCDGLTRETVAQYCREGVLFPQPNKCD
jgi:hypothetical protein